MLVTLRGQRVNKFRAFFWDVQFLTRELLLREFLRVSDAKTPQALSHPSTDSALSIIICC